MDTTSETERELPGIGSAPVPPEQRAGEERARLVADAKVLAAAARALAPLARPQAWVDLKKVRKVLDRIEPRLERAREIDLGVRRLWEELRGWIEGAGERLRQRLGRELKELSAAEGVGMRVITREPEVEVRLPPLSVAIDFEQGLAELRFARLGVATCPADAVAILGARREALKVLEGGLEPPEFFDRCLRAWKAARAARSPAERVEILDFLPYLALEMQPARFREDPRRDRFKDYGRVRFAYDILRLRRARLLSREGWRLNLGVATGTTASQKKRVIYFEDENGNGEYKLTIFFTREEG